MAIYGPTTLFVLAQGAIIPVLPALATERGSDLAGAALISSLLVVGTLVGNFPSAWLVARVGERRTMIIATIFAVFATLGALFSSTFWLLGVSIFVAGISAAAFGLARHSLMTNRIPLSFRARAMSLLGGTYRFGMFLGPLVTSALIVTFGTVDSALWFSLICLLATLALVVFSPDPEKTLPLTAAAQRAGNEPDSSSDGILRTAWNNRAVLARLGAAAASIAAVRSARQVLIPLWGTSLGIDTHMIALVVALSAAIDLVLFYPSGFVMDRFGRLWAALPAVALMGIGFAVLTFTHDLHNAEGWYFFCAAMLGFGNGFSSGILLTLGSDVAPQRHPTAFLSSWQTFVTAGSAAAPVMITIVTAVLSLPVAAGAIGVIAFAGTAALARYVPRFVPKNTHNNT